MNPHLLIFAALYGIGIVLTVGLGFFVWAKAGRNKLSTLFLLMNLSIAAVELTLLGIGIARSPELAYLFSLLNILNIFIVVFMAHWVLEVVGRSKAARFPLMLIYAVGIGLFLWCLVRPEAFFLPPVPKLYLNFFFVAGPLYLWMRVYFTLVACYFLYELWSAYRAAVDNTIKNRIKYVFVGILYGMVVGHTALFLVYDIPIDPIWSAFFPLYTLPFAYAIIRYELMDIKIIAKRALIYGVSIVIVAELLSMVSFLNDLLVGNFPAFPRWILPFIVATVTSTLGFFIWLRLREEEVLKYEFITVVTHKFRTPLTQIKWTVENLFSGGLKADEVSEGLKTITHASDSLAELTNTLIKAADSEEISQHFRFRSVTLPRLVADALKSFQKQIAEKRLRVRLDIPETVTDARGDMSRLALVIENLVGNAVVYTAQNGEIELTLREKNGMLELSVRDSGVGISREELSKVFDKFYRTEAAQKLMTEGLGIGLYIAKQIVDRHGGRLTAHSEGVGKGATFTLSLPEA